MWTIRPSEGVTIVGAGGFGRELATWINRYCYHNFPVLGFIDNNYKDLGSTVNNLPVLGDDSWVDKVWEESGLKPNLAIGIGHPHVKRKIYEKFKDRAVFPNFLCNCVVGDYTTLDMERDSGVIVTPGCTLTCNIKLGKHVMVNINSTVGHDCILDDFVTVSPGANVSGKVHAKEGSYIGTGSAVVENVTIGEWSIIGGQAFVAKDIPPNVTAVGVPAKVIKTREAGWHL